MSKRSNIVAGVKANSQAAPQNPNTYGSPGSGGISPLLAQYQQWTIGQGGSPYDPLPRDAAQFLLGQFGPLSPIQPMPIDEPGPGGSRPDPRRFQYPVGWNMPHSAPGSEGLKLTDFPTLRTYADLYSVARTCIQVRKNEIRGLEWDIHPTKEAEKKMRGDHKAHKEFGERRDKAIKFFRRPDPDYVDFSSWIDAMLEDVFVVDALSLFLHPTRMAGKGLFGSSLAALELIDGTTIRPLLNLQGGKPLPPSPAYQQYLQGIPRVDLMTLLSGDDVKEMDAPVKEYRGDQLMYLPYTSRSWTPYGFPPIERSVVPVLTGLRKQQYQLDYFDEGTLPGAYVSPGEQSGWTPNQIKDLQDALNAIAGDPAWKHKIVALPPGSTINPMRQADLADQFDEIVMTQVCMAFDVMPMELGISPKVSTTQSGGAANQMAKASEDINERKALKPLLRWLKTAIFDAILQQVCGQTDMEWTWEGLEEGEDEATKTTLIKDQIATALLSIDEGRAELGKTPWGLPETSDPGIMTGTGFTPLGQWNPITEAPGQQPGEQPPGALPPGSPPPPGGGGSPITTIGPGNKPPTPPPAPPGSNAGSGGQQATKSADALKPVLSELDSLRRHLNKGRDIASWECRHIDNDTVDVIDQLLKMDSMQPDEAVGQVMDRIEKDWSNIVFDPSKHPRGAGGRFGAGSGGGGLGQWGNSQSGRISVGYSGHAPSGGGAGKKPKKPKKGGKGKKPKKGGKGKKPLGFTSGGRAASGTVNVKPPKPTPQQRQAQRLAAQKPPAPNDPVAWQYYDEWYNAKHQTEADLTKGGDAERLREYWLEHIPWGSPGDFDTCVEQVTQHAHMSPSQAKGYCNLLHHRALGFYPATHAAMERGHKCGGLLDARDVIKSATGTTDAHAQMAEDYPEKSIDWMKGLHWRAESVPTDEIDFDDDERWQAAHEPAKVDRFKKKISHRLAKDKPIKPVILIEPPGTGKKIVIDGHHRSLAYRDLGEDVQAYVARVPSRKGPWLETHASQYDADQRATTDEDYRHTPPKFGKPRTHRGAFKPGKGKPGRHGNHAPGEVSLPKALTPGKVTTDFPGWKYDRELSGLYAVRLTNLPVATETAAAAWLAVHKVEGGPVPPPESGDPTPWLSAQMQQWLDQIASSLTDLWTEAFFLGFESGNAIVDLVSPDWGAWKPGHPEAARSVVDLDLFNHWLNHYGVPTIRSIQESRMNQLVDLLHESVGQGWSTDKLAKEMRDILDDPKRARMISVTETARAVSQGTLAAYREADVERVQWVTALDARVCPPCDANEAMGAIPVGSAFFTGDDAPPAHPHCRCALVAVPDGVEVPVRQPTVIKVGPKGYVHGWIYVGPQEVGGRVFHAQHGNGTVVQHDVTPGKKIRGSVHVQYDSGHTEEYRARFKTTSKPRIYGPTIPDEIDEEIPQPRSPKVPAKKKPADPYADTPYKVQGMRVLDRKTGERVGLIFTHGDLESQQTGRGYSIRFRGESENDKRFATQKDAVNEIHRRETDRRKAVERKRLAEEEVERQFAERRNSATEKLDKVSAAELRQAGANKPEMSREDRRELVRARRKRIMDLHKDNLRVHDSVDDPTIQQHLKEFFMVPESHHEVIAKRGYKIDVGLGTVADYHPELASETPSGYEKTATWKDSAGAHNAGGYGSKPWMVFGNTVKHGSDNMVAHEMGHALDHSAETYLSTSLGLSGLSAEEYSHWGAGFKTYFNGLNQYDASIGQLAGDDLDRPVRMLPYYRASGNGGHANGHKEMFAEAYAAYVNSKQAQRTEAITRTLSGGVYTGDDHIGQMLSEYFDDFTEWLEKNR